MDAKRIILGLGLLASAALAACSGGATPQLIGSYPRFGTAAPYIAPSRVYSTRLDIAVSDVDFAAQQAARLAAGNGGHLVASQSWYQDERLHTLLTLAVPASQFDPLRQSLIALGQLVDEQLTSQPAPWPAYARLPEATISVTFSTYPPLPQAPALPNFGWSPVRTFAQAFAVFAGIFTVLIDVLIWVSVVVGPFVLMGLGLRWLVRRTRHPM
jgi:hypothetical protein